MTLPATRLSDAELLARVQSFHWWHSITLRPGLTTFGGKNELIMAQEEEALFSPFDLTGRSVVDIGAWNGAFSFAAKRRGAARVLATDSYIWNHPIWRGREAFELARAELGLDVQAKTVDPPDISEKLGVFDVVLFLGVFYHLYDPIEVMVRLRRITRQMLLVETHQDLTSDARPGMVFYPGDILNQDATNWWGPNPSLMLSLFLQLGFTRIFYRDHPTLGRSRGIYAAFTPEVEDSLIRGFDANWLDLDVPGAIEGLLAP
jgi:tRNA (mo5U34)-methyltransferase